MIAVISKHAVSGACFHFVCMGGCSSGSVSFCFASRQRLFLPICGRSGPATAWNRLAFMFLGHERFRTARVRLGVSWPSVFVHVCSCMCSRLAPCSSWRVNPPDTQGDGQPGNRGASTIFKAHLLICNVSFRLSRNASVAWKQLRSGPRSAE